MRITKSVSILLLLTYCCLGCETKQSKPPAVAKGLPKGRPQNLDYQTVSILVEDMSKFAAGARKLDKKALVQIEDLYRGVTFVTKQPPLLYNVYGDPAGKQAVFVVYPKDPRTGSNYLLTFDKKLPVINEETIEIQIRTGDPERPLNCLMPVSDQESYVKDYRNHKYEAEYTFAKKFLQAGTFDFDALTVSSYRTHGHAFIVFDLVKMKLYDMTANLSTECRQ